MCSFLMMPRRSLLWAFWPPAPGMKARFATSARTRLTGTFRPARTPRPIHLLKRGDINKPGAEASPGALACVPGLEARLPLADRNHEGSRRAALARWVTDPRNVLTWRSIVNRIWHYHFGRGLVDTPNDFGRMGGVPSHSELLDWLAIWFQEQGGSLKSLHRLIVTSAVYRQASVGWAMPTKTGLIENQPRARADAHSK